MIAQIQNVTLLGADGRLGPSVLNELINAGFHVTVLKRGSSKSPSNYPPSVSEVRVDDSFSYPELVQALTGQDAVIAAFPAGRTLDLQKRLAQAAATAGVKHFVPADFGSCDSQSARAMQLVPLYKRKTEMREYLQELVEKNPGFAWTSLVCGHFFDMSLEFLHIWPRERRADVLDNGQTPFSASTLAQVGRATAAILKKANNPAVRNRLLYVQSFCVTQDEVLDALQEVMAQAGEEDFKWAVTKLKSDEFTRESEEKRDKGDTDAIEDLVWVLGTLEADWRAKDDFAMDRLGLKDEDLKQACRRVVAQEGLLKN